ncbi:type VI secretion system ImpA family N-terminal domain-containing protein [Vibrio hepatarius]|uniref:type VI secretion system ImpA family N-terminal domain-containing protein n=1 Tax=Vibrio hepatarius TaxID=171383 RepID=UPI002FDAF71F
MTTNVYINQSVFTVGRQSTLLRENDTYHKIKDSINSRTSFLFGVTHWEEVHDMCTLLGTTDGLDFLTSSYYSVASLKVLGLKGLADGLELMLACYAQDIEHKQLTSHRKKEMIEWMISKVLSDLKVVNPNKESLRELYRCERALQELYELCKRYQPEELPNIESVAFIIFEYIDALETAGSKVSTSDSAQKATGTQKSDAHRPKRKSYFKKSFAFAVMVGALVVGYWMYNPHAFDKILGTSKNTPQDLMVLMKRQMNQSILQSNADWVKAVPDIEMFSSNNDEMQTSFETQREQLKQYSAEQGRLLDEELERFYLARTSAANIAKQMLASDANSVSAKALESYVLSLSPIYARLDYVENLIEQGSYCEAEKELLILDSRVTRIAKDMSDKQITLLNHSLAD